MSIYFWDATLALVVDESKWLTSSLALAIIAACVSAFRLRGSELPPRQRALVVLNLLFGVTIGTMAFGHLLAVTTKLILGTLSGPVWLFYAIGGLLALPSWLLILHTRKLSVPGHAHERTTIALNAWLVLTLVGLGLPNVPLAIPGVLNVAYQEHKRPAVGWLILGATAVVTVGLFLGSVVFFVSGQSFEEFRGLQ